MLASKDAQPINIKHYLLFIKIICAFDDHKN